MPTEQQLNDYKEKLDEQSVLSSVDDYQPLQELAFDDDTTDDELQSRDFPTSANQVYPFSIAKTQCHPST